MLSWIASRILLSCSFEQYKTFWSDSQELGTLMCLACVLKTCRTILYDLCGPECRWLQGHSWMAVTTTDLQHYTKWEVEVIQAICWLVNSLSFEHDHFFCAVARTWKSYRAYLQSNTPGIMNITSLSSHINISAGIAMCKTKTWETQVWEKHVYRINCL